MNRPRRLLLILLSVLPMFLTLLIFPLFPQLIPMGGGWENKYVQLVLPGVLLVLGLGGLFLHRQLLQRGRQDAAALVNRFLLFFLLAGLVLHAVLTLTTYWNITVSTTADMQSQSFDLMRVLFLGISVAAMVAGNQLPRRPFGDPLGVCTRWTVQDREIWRKTHSLAGPLLVFAGILGLVFCAFCQGWLLTVLCLVVLVAPIIAACLYSRALWKKKFS